MALGLTVAIISGYIIGKLNMENHLEDWVRAMRNTKASEAINQVEITWSERIESGFNHVSEVVGKVWPYIIIGIGLGALIHG